MVGQLAARRAAGIVLEMVKVCRRYSVRCACVRTSTVYRMARLPAVLS